MSACSHAGLVDEGMCLYASMIRDYMILAKWNIAPAWLTFLVVLAIYRRQRIWSWKYPVNKQVATWMALFDTCRIHGNMEMAEHNAKRILEMKPENAASYVLPSNIFAAVGNIYLCETVEHQRKEKGAKKCSHLD